MGIYLRKGLKQINGKVIFDSIELADREEDAVAGKDAGLEKLRALIQKWKVEHLNFTHSELEQRIVARFFFVAKLFFDAIIV